MNCWLESFVFDQLGKNQDQERKEKKEKKRKTKYCPRGGRETRAKLESKKTKEGSVRTTMSLPIFAVLHSFYYKYT